MTATATRPGGASIGEPRRYRFPPLVHTGLFGAMPAGQVGVLATGFALTFIGVLVHLAPYAFAPALVGAVVGFKRHGIWALHEWIPMRIGWWRRSRRGGNRWLRPIPLVGTRPDPAAPGVPAVLDGLTLFEADARWVKATSARRAGIAVIHDRATATMSGVVRVVGDGQFSLASHHDQDLRLAGWGEAIAGFCRERSPVVRIAWQEWATTTPTTTSPSPSPSPERTPAPVGPVERAQVAYRQLLADTRPLATTHDVLVTLTVDTTKVRCRRGGDVPTAATDRLVEELRLVTARLEAAGLHVEPPLCPAELVTVIRSRSHPPSAPAIAALGRSLAATVGVGIADAGPMVVDEHFDAVCVDGSWHRSWWVEGWPRLEVPAAWMDLILIDTTMTRTFSVVFEPIPPSAAARSIDQAAVALESATAAKQKRGFRVKASDRRARDEIDRREHELVAGYGDLAYAGFITITAGSRDRLDDHAADLEQTAAHAGLQLRPLEARHARGWVAALPVGRTVTHRR